MRATAQGHTLYRAGWSPSMPRSHPSMNAACRARFPRRPDRGTPMTETILQFNFMEMLEIPLDRPQRLAVLGAMARQGDWLSAEDILLAAALLDHAARHRIDGRELPVEEVAEIKSNYIEELLTDADPEVARILVEAWAVRERPEVVH